MRDINHGELEIYPNLRCGEAYTIRIDHGFDHVLRELMDRSIDQRDRSALLAQNGITVLDDG
jgi:hypothetical protein